MTRAEEAAMKAYPVKMEMQYDQETYLPLWEEDMNVVERVCFRRGYEQAEKDLALTWEDIAKIDQHIIDVNNEMAVDSSQEISRQKFYEEVLRRFNETRNDRQRKDPRRD